MTQTNPHPENPLSSTDSPETYSTGDVNQGASQTSTPPALAPVEPDELDEIIKRLDSEIQDATNRQQHIRFAPTYKHAARKALLAWRKQAVDAAVAEKDYEIEQAFIAGFAASGEGYNGELLRDRGEFDQEVQRLSEQYVERLKNKDNHETT